MTGRIEDKTGGITTLREFEFRDLVGHDNGVFRRFTFVDKAAAPLNISNRVAGSIADLRVVHLVARCCLKLLAAALRFVLVMNQRLSEMTRIGIKNVEIVINCRRDANITNVGDVKRPYVENGCISLAPCREQDIVEGNQAARKRQRVVELIVLGSTPIARVNKEGRIGAEREFARIVHRNVREVARIR